MNKYARIISWVGVIFHGENAEFPWYEGKVQQWSVSRGTGLQAGRRACLPLRWDAKSKAYAEAPKILGTRTRDQNCDNPKH